MVDMGRIDRICENSTMLSFVDMMCEGHLQRLLHMFAYLKLHQNSIIVMDPNYPDIEKKEFIRNY